MTLDEFRKLGKRDFDNGAVMDDIELAIEERDAEKARRVYYQDIVYHVCNVLDRIFAKTGPSRGIVCGTVNDPSVQVQEYMNAVEDRCKETSDSFNSAAKLVADMHRAAMGGVVRGPIRGVVEDVADLRAALDKIVDLYGHYADLLNGYDGGRRMRFKSGQEWLDRLQELAMEESHELHRNAMTDERLSDEVDQDFPACENERSEA